MWPACDAADGGIEFVQVYALQCFGGSVTYAFITLFDEPRRGAGLSCNDP
jgi:hypothetical protein